MLHHLVSGFLERYGYVVPFAFVMVESLGIPFPGETSVVAAAVLVRRTHHLELWLVILAAALGAVIGDNIGYGIGRTGGYHVAHKHAKRLHLSERRLQFGVWIFRRHGSAIVFFGRWIALLRMWAALLAGINEMDWRSFFVYNALGGALWSACFAILGYELGDDVRVLETWVGGGLWILFGGIVAAYAVYFLRNEDELEDRAERELSPRVKRRIARET